jgi:hypothetical protein
MNRAVYRGIPAILEDTVACFLIGLRRSLIAVSCRLIAVRASLVRIGKRLIPVRARLKILSCLDRPVCRAFGMIA